MKTSRDFEDLLAYFNARGVEYLVVGAHAFAFHGKPRFTKDLDLLVRSSPAVRLPTLRCRWWRGGGIVQSE